MPSRHFEQNAVVNAPAQKVFAFANDHKNLAFHMNKSSWMMAGGKMETKIDEGKGQKIGSHIKMSGRVLGIGLELDEVITKYEPPITKVWKTLGTPKLLVIGNYQLGFEIEPQGNKSTVRVFIDYEPPESNRWLGYLFANMYAKWCVKQMISSIKGGFKN